MKSMRRRLPAPALAGTRPVPEQARPPVGATMSVVFALAVVATTLPAPAKADDTPAAPLPMPTIDFAMTGKSMRGAAMDLAHHDGKMRVELKKPGANATVISIIDLKSAKMLMLVPNMSHMAMEVELPPQYAALTMQGTGKKLGQAEVAGETCDLWQVDKAGSSNTVACITEDGIALRTQADVGGTSRTIFEAQSVTRAPQSASLFSFPPDVQIVQLDGKMLNNLPGALGNIGGLGALGGLLQQGQDALKGE